MKKNIEDYIFLKENFLEDEFCDHTIDILNKASWIVPWVAEPIPKGQTLALKKAGISLGDIPLESELIDFNNMTNMALHREVKKIEAEMMPMIPDVLMEYFNSFKFNWLRGWSGYSQIKWNRYSLGQGMMTHWDNVSHSFPDTSGVSFLTVIGFLNDDYEGGDLILCEDKKIDAKKGNLLIFPSSFIYPHQVTPLTKGQKFSYVSWVY